MSFASKAPSKPLPVCPKNPPREATCRRRFKSVELSNQKNESLLFDADLAHARYEGILPDLTPACAGSVLGYALLHPPSGSGRYSLTVEILGCNDDHELLTALAHL